MKLESLKLGKFKDSTLKREQMFVLNGGGIATGGGNITDYSSSPPRNFDYGYDANRNGTMTFHNRTNVALEKVELPTLTLGEEDIRILP